MARATAAATTAATTTTTAAFTKPTESWAAFGADRPAEADEDSGGEATLAGEDAAADSAEAPTAAVATAAAATTATAAGEFHYSSKQHAAKLSQRHDNVAHGRNSAA